MIVGIKLSFDKQHSSTSSYLVYSQNAVFPLFVCGLSFYVLVSEIKLLYFLRKKKRHCFY